VEPEILATNVIMKASNFVVSKGSTNRLSNLAYRVGELLVLRLVVPWSAVF
jgi:hypothetical protein